MSKGRLEAFSDGVIAIIITIMVLEMKVPHGDRWEELLPLLPTFLSYVLSFVYVGIYWNNHHHMLHATTAVTGAMLWANLHLLFWLSLFPFTTGWMGENHFTAVPALWSGAVDGRDRLSHAPASHHPRARAGLNLAESNRVRLEGRAITAAVYRSDRCFLPFPVDRPGDFRDRCADLANSGPAYRKTSCHVGSWENAGDESAQENARLLAHQWPS
jgi:Endosomal/lysosomal potassium channel TMEM175